MILRQLQEDNAWFCLVLLMRLFCAAIYRQFSKEYHYGVLPVGIGCQLIVPFPYFAHHLFNLQLLKKKSCGSVTLLLSCINFFCLIGTNHVFEFGLSCDSKDS